MRPRIARAWAALAVLVSLAFVGSALGQVPPDKQALILARSLAYDNNLRARAGSSMVIAVVWKAGNGQSESAAEAAFRAWKAIEGVKIQDLPLNVVKLAYSSKESLKSAISAQGIDALYCCPGLEGDVSALREVSNQLHVLTLGSREEMVRAGMSLGVFSNDGKATIIVNLQSSKDEGASLSSDLLRLATVLR